MVLGISLMSGRIEGLLGLYSDPVQSFAGFC